MDDDSKDTSTTTDTAILADFRRRFEKEFRAGTNRFWVVMPGDRPGACRVHVADDAEAAAAILLGGPPKRAE